MHIESETTIDRPRAEVFDYLARAEHLPQFVDRFSSVRQTSQGEPGTGTVYGYEMKRGSAKGTFEWTRFEPSSRLAWSGPPTKSGPGTMAPSGCWELTDATTGTHVKLVMTPTPGGLFKLLAPLMQLGMRKGNAKALGRLKERLEGGQATA